MNEWTTALNKWLKLVVQYLKRAFHRIREEVWSRGQPWKQWARKEQWGWKNSRAFFSGSRWWRWYPRRARGNTDSIASSACQALLIVLCVVCFIRRRRWWWWPSASQEYSFSSTHFSSNTQWRMHNAHTHTHTQQPEQLKDTTEQDRHAAADLHLFPLLKLEERPKKFSSSSSFSFVHRLCTNCRDGLISNRPMTMAPWIVCQKRFQLHVLCKNRNT